jgi:hypothetical protein
MRTRLVISVAFLCLALAAAVQAAAPPNNDLRLRIFVHHPKHPGKPVASSCSVTVNDQVNHYGLAGWQMPAAGMSYRINYSTKPKNLGNDDVLLAVAAAFDTWTGADSNLLFHYDGSTTAKNATFDGVNALLWKRLSRNTIAVTYVWYYTSTGALVESDTMFNSAYKWGATDPSAGDCSGVLNAYDLQNIATHEFGHWVGLDDLYANVDADLTMYGYGELGELKKDTLGAGDITGANAIAP